MEYRVVNPVQSSHIAPPVGSVFVEGDIPQDIVIRMLNAGEIEEYTPPPPPPKILPKKPARAEGPLAAVK